MASWYWAFWYALVFLTRIPAPYLKRVDDEVAQRSLVFYPLVGVIVGVLSAAFVISCWWYNPAVSPLLLAALTVAIWTLITGGLHLDGLADSADAWVGGLGDKEKTLEIMKDPRVGPIGALSIGLLLLIQFAALQVLFSPGLPSWQVLTTLLLIPAMARASVVGMLATTPYVRAKGLASSLVKGATRLRVFSMLGLIAIAAVIVFQQKAVLLLLLWLVLNAFFRHVMIKRIGGCTGDTIGASIALQEALLLAAFTL